MKAKLNVNKQGTKPTNPKDAIGVSKLPLGLVPDVVLTEASFAFLEGALKYGRFNWRIAGVRSSIYRDAIGRHLAKWWNGEDRDRRTRVRHLASIIASCGILLDAELSNKLTDDRPPRVDMSVSIDEAGALVAHLKKLFAAHNPKQFTIADIVPFRCARCFGSDPTCTDCRGIDHGDDTGRESQVSDRRSHKKGPRVQAQARAKRHGRART